MHNSIRLYRDDRGIAHMEGAKHVVYHSPTGIEWGYGGSGPADCARSILTHFLGKEIADGCYQQFKWDTISVFPMDGGTITKNQVEDWYKEHLQDEY